MRDKRINDIVAYKIRVSGSRYLPRESVALFRRAMRGILGESETERIETNSASRYTSGPVRLP